MARPLRVEFEDALYHLCMRGNARQRIFWDDQDRVRFLEFLEQWARRFPDSTPPFLRLSAMLSQHFTGDGF
jgi:hypothetical protein